MIQRAKTYTELLKMPEWFRRRAEIIELANRKCHDCGACQIGCESCDFHDMPLVALEVHHKYYVRGRKPWEYPDEALESLCHECHEQRTLLDDVLRIAIGILEKPHQEWLLAQVKNLLSEQAARHPGYKFPYKDLPSELADYCRRCEFG